MQTRKKRSAGRIVLTVLGVLLGIVLTAVIAGVIVLNSMLNRISRVEPVPETLPREEIEQILMETDPVDDSFTGKVLRPEDVTMPTAPAEQIEEEEHIINILLIGQDRYKNQSRQRSDAMILCTINTEKKTLVMTSLMRDMYVQLPIHDGTGYVKNRINANYPIGGMEMLNECIRMNFGIDIDHNIEVDFSGFEQVIDLIGGVDIELTWQEAAVIQGGAYAGKCHLNGKQALEYSRIRKLDSEFIRTSRQRKVMVAVINQIRGLSLTELTDLANSLFPLITTDMTNSDIVKYVLEFFPLLPELKITTQRVPHETTYYSAMIDGMAVIVPDLEANIAFLKDTIG